MQHPDKKFASQPRTRRGLIEVANPGDETAWVGGAMIMRPDREWTVICLGRPGSHGPAVRFNWGMNRYPARGHFLNLPADDAGRNQERSLGELLQRHLPSSFWDLAITYALRIDAGLYPLKSAVGKALAAMMWTGGALRTRAFWAIPMSSKQGESPEAGIGSHAVCLAPHALEGKLTILTDLYCVAADRLPARIIRDHEAFLVSNTPEALNVMTAEASRPLPESRAYPAPVFPRAD